MFFLNNSVIAKVKESESTSYDLPLFEVSPTLYSTYGNFNSIYLSNAMFDDFLLENSSQNKAGVDRYTMANPDAAGYKWNTLTLAHANFNTSTAAGDTDLGNTAIKVLKVQRSKNYSVGYSTIHSRKIDSVDDYDLSFIDYTARNNTEYYYKITLEDENGVTLADTIPVNLTAMYKGVQVIFPNKTYSLHIGADITINRNKPVSSVETLYRKYPFVISNGTLNYSSGSVTGILAEYDENTKEWNYSNGWILRNRLFDDLNSGVPFLLKKENGEMWLCRQTNTSLSTQHENNQSFEEISFDWTEIGDCEDTELLAKYGFLTGAEFKLASSTAFTGYCDIPNGLNIRSTPDLEGEVVGSVVYKEVCEISKIENNWGYIGTGWIYLAGVVEI